MLNSAGAAGFLIASLATSLAWGKIVWYSDKRSEIFRRALFFAISLSRARPPVVQSFLLGAVYYTFGALVSVLFIAVYRIPLAPQFLGHGFSWPLVVLGTIGEISLAGVLVEIGCRIPTRSTPEHLAGEVGEIPWVKGIEQLPAVTVPLLAATGGALEELFFRGVLLITLIHKYHFHVPVAIAVATAFFCIQQMLQVRTLVQMLLIGWSCVAISLVGGALVVLTDNPMAAVLCHASFAFFWIGRGLNRDDSRFSQKLTG